VRIASGCTIASVVRWIGMLHACADRADHEQTHMESGIACDHGDRISRRTVSGDLA
jgi:hypothetical protein